MLLVLPVARPYVVPTPHVDISVTGGEGGGGQVKWKFIKFKTKQPKINSVG